jgi:hypothetical protein
MPKPRKYPIRIFVNGSPVQVRSVEGNLFQSKDKYYRAYYHPSGQLMVLKEQFIDQKIAIDVLVE